MTAGRTQDGLRTMPQKASHVAGSDFACWAADRVLPPGAMRPK